jgi:thioredoxin reductase (NADPH)
MDTENVIILGTGPAGLTAALYTARALLNPLVLAGEEPGGQLTTTTEIDNFPGFSEGILGADLMTNMQKQAERFGARIIQTSATKIDLSTFPLRVESSKGEVHLTKSLIIATGASAKWLGLPSEAEYRGKGVSSCGTCDGFFFRNKEVFCIGGGNTALEEALFLTKFASKVTMVHRRDSFRGEKVLQNQVVEHPKITVIWNSSVEEIIGDGQKVTSIRLKNLQSGEESTHTTDGVFIFIGHHPNTTLVEGQLSLDEVGYVKTVGEVGTDVKGVFVAGDVADSKYRQAITAAGAGCKAALEVEHYLHSLTVK